nr:hypothetical protein [uncultured Flavobacterium sp.]
MYQENIDIKKEFYNHFYNHMTDENIMPFFYEMFVYGTAYVVGGYFRDFINKKQSRDIDIIVDLKNELLIEIIKNYNFKYKINRHGGIKLIHNNLEIDIWNIENNWAFKNNLVKLNEDDKLNSIAKGCFYNYDALVINLHNFSYSLRFYKDFVESRKLNILQERSIYKNLNPTTEANILRAFFLKDHFDISYTENTFNYLTKKVGSLEDKYEGAFFSKLLDVKSNYPKYNILTPEKISKYLIELKTNDLPNNQMILNL